MRITLMLMLLTLISLAWANDGAMIGEGGRVSRMPGKHTSIRMVREWVNMDVYADNYRVKVQFIFQNDGPATTVTMGFPESGGGADVDANYYRKHSGFESFHTWVDGSEVKAIRKIDNAQDEDYAAYWVKTVAFAAHQQRTVRVEYVGPLGNESDGLQYVKYDFTGGNWKGEVEESDLNIAFHAPGAFIIHSEIALKQNSNTLFHRWTHWQAENEFFLYYFPTRLDGLLLRHNTEKKFSYFVSAPGKGLGAGVNPPIIEKRDMLFVGLQQLVDFINPNDSKSTTPRVQLDWDTKTRAATLRYAGRILHITFKNPIMRVGGSPDVTLPGEPFLSMPLKNDDDKTS